MTQLDIRQKMRAHRKHLSPAQVQIASQKIFEKIIQHPEFINAQRIAYYISHENEIDPSLIIQYARELKKQVYLPIISEKNELTFYLISSHTSFKINKFGIDEPIVKNQSPISPDQLELMFIPLVAFDVHGNRLGRGAGYYDRALQFAKNKLPDQKPILIGLAYEFQKVEKIIPESWDIKMDWVVTECVVQYS